MKRLSQRLNLRAFVSIDAVDHAAAHHPVEPFSIRDQGVIQQGRVVRAPPRRVQRRRQDARIFQDMTAAEERAFELINLGWRFRVGDTLPRSNFSLLRIDKTSSPGNDDATVRIARNYTSWSAACRKADIRTDLALCVICEAESVTATARKYRVRPSVIVPNLLAALGLYVDMHLNRK